MITAMVIRSVGYDGMSFCDRIYFGGNDCSNDEYCF